MRLGKSRISWCRCWCRWHSPTLYHWILGAGRPVMMAVNVAGWPGFTYRSSAGTWMEGGAAKQFKPVRKAQGERNKDLQTKKYHLWFPALLLRCSSPPPPPGSEEAPVTLDRRLLIQEQPARHRGAQCWRWGDWSVEGSNFGVQMTRARFYEVTETYFSSCSGGKRILVMEVGLKSVCSHFFTKAVDQPSESASMKTTV